MITQSDKKTVLNNLMELGKSKGQLSNKEILDAIGEMDFDPEYLEKFYDALESNGVEIVETMEDIILDDAALTSSILPSVFPTAMLPLKNVCPRLISDWLSALPNAILAEVCSSLT